VPPRPHPIVLVALAVACFVVAFLVAPRRALPSGGHGAPAARAASRLAASPTAHSPIPGRASTPAPPRAAPSSARSPSSAPHTAWRWPLRGAVVGAFRLTPRAPFARGQRRGIDVAAAPGTAVRAACAGRVTFAGPVPRHGLAVTVRCGALVATYLRLGHLAVRRGAHAALGARLGTLGPDGRLRLGARHAGERRGYVDPLALLRDPTPSAPPVVGPAPRARRPRPAPLPVAPPRPAPAPARAATRHLPWPAYPALALIATALPVGSLVHRRRRRRTTTAAAAAHEGP
jgi:murein DD-endopeptidase MepM/ murein hydrolase activator NlpD